MSMLAALALNCEVAPFTKWDRKSYYYPDLPKNYQISQYDLPLGSNGYIEIPLDDGQTKRIRILRAHLEEDAGKNLHDRRQLLAGGPEPRRHAAAGDRHRAGHEQPVEEVRATGGRMQRIVRWLGVSEGRHAEGAHAVRAQHQPAHRPGRTASSSTPIVEVKNLNSFRALERSVAYETERQLDAFLETGVTLQMGNKSTRGWNDDDQVTVLQREKEEAHDYRYFPDPDLVPVTTTPEWLDEIRSHLCELPLARQMRYVTEYGLSDYDAGVLTAERGTAEFFEQTLQAGGEPKRVCNLLTQVGLKLAKEKGGDLPALGIEPAAVADLAKMVDAGTVSATAANTILESMVATGKAPAALAEELNLIQKSDAGELEGIVDQVLAENAQAVEDVVSGGKKSKKARGFLLGQVIQKTKGQANPKVVSEILQRKLS